MQQLRRNTVSRAISMILIAALLTPQCLVYLSGVSAQSGQNVPAVAVVPFQDVTGKASPALMREATAAAALALEDSKEYLVTSIADLDREMQALSFTPPLSQAQQVRLGERLHVEKVLVGQIANLSVDSRTGRARVAMQLKMLDTAIGEYLDGSVVEIYTKAIPGFNGDVAQVTHEALREVADAAVLKMLSSTVRRGAVELVDDQSNININLGTNDGIQTGTDLLVMRPTWQPDVEQVVMRRVGVIRVADIEAQLAVARSVEGGIPTTGDRVYRLYKPYSVMQAEARGRKVKSSTTLVAGLLLLAGLVSVVAGDTTAAPSGITTTMTQQAPGQNPYVLVKIRTTGMARGKSHGMLIFRAANNPDFPAVADYLIDAMAGEEITRYTDDPQLLQIVEDREITFQYIDYTEGNDADYQDGTVTCSYNHNPMVAGTRYYYKVRRISDPVAPPGTNPPIGTAQVEPVDPDIDPDPDWRVITEASNYAGPITYFTAPLLSTPLNSATNEVTTNVNFSWQTSTGANEYIVEVFPASDPDGSRPPILQSAIKRDTGSTVMSTVIYGPFSASTTYYWRVGCRQSSDPVKPYNELTGKYGWLYSGMRSFTTATAPPPPPGTSSAQPKPVPARHGGFWGGGRGGR